MTLMKVSELALSARKEAPEAARVIDRSYIVRLEAVVVLRWSSVIECSSSRILLLVTLAADMTAMKEQNARLLLEKQIADLAMDKHRRKSADLSAIRGMFMCCKHPDVSVTRLFIRKVAKT